MGGSGSESEFVQIITIREPEMLRILCLPNPDPQQWFQLISIFVPRSSLDAKQISDILFALNKLSFRDQVGDF